MFGPRAACSLDPIVGKDGLDLIPQRLFDNGRMFSRISSPLVSGLAAIDAILEQQIDRAAGKIFARRTPCRHAAPVACFGFLLSSVRLEERALI